MNYVMAWLYNSDGRPYQEVAVLLPMPRSVEWPAGSGQIFDWDAGMRGYVHRMPMPATSIPKASPEHYPEG